MLLLYCLNGTSCGLHVQCNSLYDAGFQRENIHRLSNMMKIQMKIVNVRNSKEKVVTQEYVNVCKLE